VANPRDILPGLYRAFNDRDIDAVLERMHPAVDWPNVWEGGRVHGRGAVRAYWTRQFQEISGQVEPEAISEEPDGSITVEVHHELVPQFGQMCSITSAQAGQKVHS
jgi:hypothetical protein